VEEKGVSSTVTIVIVAIVVVIAIGTYLLYREEGLISGNEVVEIAIEGLENHRLFVTGPFAQYLANTVPKEPIYVESIDDGFPNYYLVPFVRNGRTWVVATVNTELGTFTGASYYENGLAEYLVISAGKASEIVRGEIENVGPLRDVKLVWKPCEQSWQPYAPFWAVEVDGKTVYVGQDGQLYEELTRGKLWG